jgi:hypothetical protein
MVSALNGSVALGPKDWAALRFPQFDEARIGVDEALGPGCCFERM